MTTLDMVDSQLRPLLQLFPSRRLSMENLDEARARVLPIAPTPKTDVTLEVAHATSLQGAPSVPLYIYRPGPSAAPAPCILHIHGGGFVLGAPKDLEGLHRSLCADLRCLIVSVDYRLAPETPFPGAIEDCYAALAWIFDHAETLGLDLSRVGVMGESAGGGLAAGLALLARDRGQYSLAFQHLIYPMLDDRTGSTTPPHPTAGEFIWNAHNNRFGWSALLGAAPGGAAVSPYAAAARADDLRRLPPTFIGVGALDLFVDENMDYARRLNRAGVNVELHVYPGAFHGFDLAPSADVSASARKDSVSALRRFLGKRKEG